MVRTPLSPATDRQKAQVLDLLQQGRSHREIAHATGLEPLQVSAHQSHLTRGTYQAEAADTEEVTQAIEATFGLERDLRSNIEQIEPGLKIADGGKEKVVPSGRIDIVAEDPAGSTVVIELKVGTAGRDAVAQVLSYMGDLIELSPVVRGIVVAGDFAPAAISAARAASKIRLLKYTFKFSFETVGY